MSASMRTLAEIWRGLRPIAQEIRAGRVHLDGPAKLRRAFPTWLLLSRFSSVERG
ncbi:MAG TPA: hypothetical protein VK509_22100 [Polyangiales bacterium]|nr:hypothetical protein [Polyangiales bacterium]